MSKENFIGLQFIWTVLFYSCDISNPCLECNAQMKWSFFWRLTVLRLRINHCQSSLQLKDWKQHQRYQIKINQYYQMAKHFSQIMLRIQLLFLPQCQIIQKLKKTRKRSHINKYPKQYCLMKKVVKEAERISSKISSPMIVDLYESQGSGIFAYLKNSFKTKLALNQTEQCFIDIRNLNSLDFKRSQFPLFAKNRYFEFLEAYNRKDKVDLIRLLSVPLLDVL
ncbi:unnamed protein product [Paramecium sonneborni]|uniref:Uncharacterized protein n=1 Tax=Paramecium sonneborni TaxID=65129 RepID=A0A8S1ML83_9CILI|nr:unnamed protein product [Paramecium sonneborni]